MNISDTIAAIATARGMAGIAVIRVSGNKAFEICEKVFFLKNKKNKIKKSFADIQANQAVFGEICVGGKIIDEGIAIKFAAPYSYTGEDTVELSCHGSVYIANAVLKAVIDAGARLAKAGEFTKQAYINGKISLTGAEAVGRLIEASSGVGVRVALAQSRGGLSRAIDSVSEKIKRILSEIYVYIDYPDEDLTDMPPDIMLGNLEQIKKELQKFKNSYSAGKIITGGIDTAIIGKPNTGKSTLLNMLSNRDVAIVHDTAGTTRDVIESRVNIGDFALNLFDTAGIRDTSDEIENIGISKAQDKISECSLIIGVFDVNSIDNEDLNIIKIMLEQRAAGKNVIALANKCDMKSDIDIQCLSEFAPVAVSAKENKAFESGLDTPLSAYEAIKKRLIMLYNLSEYNLDAGEILTEERQYFEVSESLDSLDSAIAALKSGQTQDIAGLDLELAAASLDRCDSKLLSEDIVDRIFRNFCVGK